MGSAVPIRKSGKVFSKTIDASNISFDTGIKNLLVSRNDSPAESLSKISKHSSQNKLRAFLKLFIPQRKKPLSNSLKSSSLQNKPSRIAELNDTIKNIENAFQPKKNSKRINEKMFFETALIRNKEQNNDAKNARKRDSLFPSFIKKINEYKKQKTGLNSEDLQLFNILKNYFKSQKAKPEFKSNLQDIKKNKATLEFLRIQRDEGLDYYTEEIYLPQRSKRKPEECQSENMGKKSTVITTNFEVKQLREGASNSVLLDPAAFSGINVGAPRRQSILKKSANRMSPMARSLFPGSPSGYQNNSCSFAENEEGIFKSQENNCEPQRSSSITINNPSLNIPLRNISPNFQLNSNSPSKRNTPQESPSNSPLKGGKFNRIVLNKCIVPLRFKTPLRTNSPLKPSTFDLKTRKSLFNEEMRKPISIIPNNFTVMATINEEERSPRSMKISKHGSQISLDRPNNDLIDETPHKENKEMELDQFPNIKNPARIVKFGKWTFSQFFQEEENRKKESKSIKSSLKVERSSSGTPPAKRVVRGGKCYSILRKNENLIIRNNRALQIIEDDLETLEKIKRRKWYDGLDNLGKIAVKNLSPTSFYFCKNKDEQEKMLKFEE